jgi:hypothetical protein
MARDAQADGRLFCAGNCLTWRDLALADAVFISRSSAARLRRDGPGIRGWSGQAVHLVHIAAGHAKRGVVLADGVLVGPFEQAVHLAVGLWYSSIWRTPNRSALALRVSSAICVMASAASFRSS